VLTGEGRVAGWGGGAELWDEEKLQSWGMKGKVAEVGDRGRGGGDCRVG
jgi:hypothetical protein